MPTSLDPLADLPLAPPAVAVTVDFNARGMWEVPFWNLAAQAGYRHLHRTRFPCDRDRPPELEELGATLAFSDCGLPGRRVWTYVAPGTAVIMLASFGNTVETMVLSDGVDGSARLAEAVEAALRCDPADDGRVAVVYWTDTSQGAQQRRERLSAPEWDEIAGNYAHRARGTLGALMAARRAGSGRLILWHGPPGTGKTTALRALAREWREWCTVHYVCDPEELFGRGAAYLADVLLAADQDHSGAPRTRLLVLEDAGELMAADARQGTGQGLSRLLNLSDGMLGHGQDLLVLVTTNEPLGRLHPAVTRPGRCWAEVELGPLEPDEANRWLIGHQSPARVSAPTPLAELYAVLRGEVVRERSAFGFAAAAA